MPFTFRLFVIAVALVLLLSAGCTFHCYRLQSDCAAPPLVAEYGATPKAETASDGLSPPGELTHSPHFRRVSLQEEEELPAPPPEAVYGEEGEELPLPNGSIAAKELIVVPIPPRPPGCLKRLLGFLGRKHCDGCAHQETAVPLAIETPLFSSSGEVYPPHRWWTSLGDANLNGQIESSLGGSFTLDAALQRLRAAQALARREASDLWPDVNAFAEAEGTFRTFASNDGFFALGLEASYEVDLWGQIGSRVEAQRRRASATAEDYHAVALTLSAEIARTCSRSWKPTPNWRCWRNSLKRNRSQVGQ